MQTVLRYAKVLSNNSLRTTLLMQKYHLAFFKSQTLKKNFEGLSVIAQNHFQK